MGVRSALGFDSARTRALQRDARNQIPNTNDPLGSVGPNVPAGFGDTHAMYPIGGLHASAWQGWPVSWAGLPMEDLGAAVYPTGGDWSGFGYGRHNPSGYLGRVSIVGTCVDLNTRQLASFPIYGVRGVELVKLPSWSTNPQPEIYADWGEMIKAATNSYQLAGEIFLWSTARFATGFPARFVVLNPTRVEVEIDGAEIVYLLDGEQLDSADVLHIKYQSIPSRLRGVGPLQWLGRNLISAAALEAYATSIATHGVWAVLKHPANLSATQAEDLKARWMGARASADGAPAVLSGGVEFEALTLSPHDMALVDLKIFDEQRICSAFGVPPFLAGLEQPGGMTYANAISLFDYHWRATLRPMAQTIASALSSWALPGDVRIEFNRDEYVRGDLGSRATAYAVLNGITDGEGRPALTVDEIRMAERFPPYEAQRLGTLTGVT